MESGARVALIEDVSTTGHQVEAAARAVTDEGGTVEAIILVIDREHCLQQLLAVIPHAGFASVQNSSVKSDFHQTPNQGGERRRSV